MRLEHSINGGSSRCPMSFFRTLQGLALGALWWTAVSCQSKPAPPNTRATDTTTATNAGKTQPEAERRSGPEVRSSGQPQPLKPGKSAACECALNETTSKLDQARRRAASLVKKYVQLGQDPYQLGESASATEAEARPSKERRAKALESQLPPETNSLLPGDLPCWDTPNGAWAFVAHDAVVCPQEDDWTKPWTARTQLKLTHVTSAHVTTAHLTTAHGAKRDCALKTHPLDWPLFEWFTGDARFESKSLECSASAHPDFPAPLPPAMFDFDGDGEPELWAGSSDKFEPDEGALYTFKNNRVERYPLPSAGNRRLQDVDGDGRPDVIWTTVFGYEPDCGDSAGTVQSPGFVAHSLPDGSFSLTDPGARHFAAQWCTAPPKRFLDVGDVVCGRLYGLPPTQLRARVVEEVPRFSCELELEGKKNPPNASAAVDALLKATEWTPPFFLDAPAVEPAASDTPPVNTGR